MGVTIFGLGLWFRDMESRVCKGVFLTFFKTRGVRKVASDRGFVKCARTAISDTTDSLTVLDKTYSFLLCNSKGKHAWGMSNFSRGQFLFVNITFYIN